MLNSEAYELNASQRLLNEIHRSVRYPLKKPMKHNNVPNIYKSYTKMRILEKLWTLIGAKNNTLRVRKNGSIVFRPKD